MEALTPTHETGGEIEQRLVPLEKKKTGLIGSLRKLYREERPLFDRMEALVQLRRLFLSILSPADKRVEISGEVKSLFDEWLLFQDLAQDSSSASLAGSGRLSPPRWSTATWGFSKWKYQGHSRASVSGDQSQRPIRSPILHEAPRGVFQACESDCL